jgi:hypothetical protein
MSLGSNMSLSLSCNLNVLWSIWFGSFLSSFICLGFLNMGGNSFE